MTEQTNVYELDTEGVMSSLFTLLTERGYDVVEQNPAGVWWITSHHDHSEIGRIVEQCFAQTVMASLQEIEQPRSDP